MANYDLSVHFCFPDGLKKDRCFREFCDLVKNALQQHETFNKTRLKMTWFHNDGTIISMSNENDLRTSMETKAIKVVMEVDESSETHNDVFSIDRMRPMIWPSNLVVPEPIQPNAFDKKKKCIFKPEELRLMLMPSLTKIYRKDPESLPFRQPVDPMALGIPDYFDIIRKPMDLSTISLKLNSGQYSDPWKYVEDVWLMFENAWMYNRKKSRVYRYCTKLSQIFEQEIDPVMQALGYCCGRKYTFNPQPLSCGKQLCTIPRNARYFSYENRFTFCQKCFNDIPGDIVTLGDEESQNQIKKEQCKEMKNDHVELEAFVDCLDCGRKQHQICVLYLESIWPDGFVCDNCMKKKGANVKDNKFNAKSLPETKLGIAIETRVNKFLRNRKVDAGQVHIRVLSSSHKLVKVKPRMRKRFVESGELAAEFPYRAKAIFAFEEIDGVDLCFFGMHVQEYGSECANPNTRQVYIECLDSVHFFTPRQYRTNVYHQILIGYMEYVKFLGYTMAHIWTCPASEGDDYIFHCRPIDQKIPTPKRVHEWYKKVFDEGMIERIVMDYKSILKKAMEDNLTSAVELPYFDGDFWPIFLEENINDGNDASLSAKIFAKMKKHNEMFLAVVLHSAQSAAGLAPIHDPDPLINCDLMDGRCTFLTLARNKHFEFSSLRRAKFSTLCMLYELHNQGQDRFLHRCKDHMQIEYGGDCDDCDVPTVRIERIGNVHEMEKIGFNLHDESNDLQEANLKEVCDQSYKICVKSLVHACECRVNNCPLPSCQKMKRVFIHTKLCKRKTNGGCRISKQLIAICCYHAELCHDVDCQVPYCRNIKIKLKQHQLQETLQKNYLLLRRMEVMDGSSGSTSPSSMSSLASSMRHKISTHRGIGLKPDVESGGMILAEAGTQVKQALQQITQSFEIVQILKPNPLLMPAFEKQRQQDKAHMIEQQQEQNMPNQQQSQLHETLAPHSTQSISSQLSSARNPNKPSQLQSQIEPVHVTSTMNWHNSVTPDRRNDVVHKLGQTIFPTSDTAAMSNKRKHDLVSCAKKVESDMFEMATSEAEYYQLAEKMYNIHIGTKRQKQQDQEMQEADEAN